MRSLEEIRNELEEARRDLNWSVLHESPEVYYKKNLRVDELIEEYLLAAANMEKQEI
uniref:Spo0E family sporulation regulatory protein-aspartic acid phosphatase n=1 Tax=Agathobacter sp. TaxID=2021311 RepID=UPI004055AFE0